MKHWISDHKAMFELHSSTVPFVHLTLRSGLRGLLCVRDCSSQNPWLRFEDINFIPIEGSQGKPSCAT
jgi:hypothetical protein